MLSILSLILIGISSIACSLTCEQNATLETYPVTEIKDEIPIARYVVNQTAPVNVVYSLTSTGENINSVEWTRRGEVVNVAAEDESSPYYYTKISETGNLKITLHIKHPVVLDTGKWKLTVTTSDTKSNVAECDVNSKFIIQAYTGLVRFREGQPARLLCDVISRPLPDKVEWHHVQMSESGPTLVLVVNATFLESNNVENAILQFDNSSDQSGFYVCNTTTDSILVHLRIKSYYAFLWPLIGIVAEVVIVLVTILIFERAQAKRKQREAYAPRLAPVST